MNTAARDAAWASMKAEWARRKADADVHELGTKLTKEKSAKRQATR